MGLCASLSERTEHAASATMPTTDAISITGPLSIIQKFDKEFRVTVQHQDHGQDGRISFSDFQMLLQKVNYEISRRALKRQFDAVDAKKSGLLKYTQARDIFMNKLSIPNLNLVKYTVAGTKIEYEGICQFFVHEQNCTKEQAAGYARNLYEWLTDEQNTSLSVDGIPQNRAVDLRSFLFFVTDLNRPASLIQNARTVDVYQDMDRPLSNYFVFSSHHTYLSGHQLLSPSTVSAIARPLQMGVRVIELDCWDGPHQQIEAAVPLVYHGHTSTKPITFLDAIESVASHAFKNSQFPVILSLAQHCCAEQQRMQVEIMYETLGPMLYVPTESDRTAREFKSPHELRGKILIQDRASDDDDEMCIMRPTNVSFINCAIWDRGVYTVLDVSRSWTTTLPLCQTQPSNPLSAGRLQSVLRPVGQRLQASGRSLDHARRL